MNHASILDNRSNGSSGEGYILAFAAAAAPLVAFFANRGVAPVVIAAAVGGLALMLRRKRVSFAMDRKRAALLVLLCLWAALSTVWAVDGGLALKGVLKLSGNLLVGVVVFSLAGRLGAAGVRLVGQGLLGGFFLTFAMLAVEVLFEGPLSIGIRNIAYGEAWGFFWLNGCSALLLLLLWPVAGMAAKRFGTLPAVLLMAVVTAVVLGLGFNTGLAAVLAGVLAALSTYLWRRKALLVMAALLGAAILLAPAIARQLDPPSIAGIPGVNKALAHRVYIWRFAADRVAERPVVGWGMNSSRVIPGGRAKPSDEYNGTYGHIMPLHPHNFALQVWLELGLPGALLLAAFMASVPLAIAAAGAGRLVQTLYMGQFTTAVAFLSSSFGVWQSWWLASLWLTGAVAVAVSRLWEEPPRGEAAQPPPDGTPQP